jgi:hypothetical protein
MEQTKFVELVKSFTENLPSGNEVEIPSGLDRVSFEIQGSTCTIFPHPEEDAVVVQAEVVYVNRLDPEPGFVAGMAVHGINYAARLNTGIVATVSPDNLLLVSKVCDAMQMSGDDLADAVGIVSDAAQRIRQIWKEISETYALAAGLAVEEEPPNLMTRV